MFSVSTSGFSTRRELLKIGALGSGGLSLMSLLGSHANGRDGDFLSNKSVVFLFLQGGPPQVETFDPKMEAPADVRSCTGEVRTRHPGVTFGGTFPQLAKRTERFSIVRSFASGDGGHNQIPVLTGNSGTKATIGAQYARLAGANDAKTGLPNHMVLLPEQVQPEIELGEPTGPFSFGYIKENYPTGGDLGAAYEGVLLDGGKGLTGNLDLKLPRNRFDDRRSLLGQLDRLKRRIESTQAFANAKAAQQQAVEVLLRGIADAFDLNQENPKTIAQYDTSRLFRMEDWHKGGAKYNRKRNQSRITNLLGKQMLLARRLCEAGCGFVTVVDSCWDFHGDGNNPPTPIGMPLLGPQVDHAVSAFLDDVQSRGLSDDIILVVTGEMGRSPKKGGKNGGTGHWGRLTPLLIAGGGLKMGQVIGKTDRSGGEATTRQYLPENLLATLMQTLFDPAKARLATGIPNELAKAITELEPIRELVP